MKNVSTILFFFVSSLFILKVTAGGGCEVTTEPPTTTPCDPQTTNTSPTTTPSNISEACKIVENFTLTQECLERCNLAADPTNPRVASALAAICVAEDCIEETGGILKQIVGVILPNPTPKCDKIPDNLPEVDGTCVTNIPAIDLNLIDPLSGGNTNEKNTYKAISLICLAVQCLVDEGEIVPPIESVGCDCSILGLPDLGLGSVLQLVCSLLDCLLSSLGLALG